MTRKTRGIPPRRSARHRGGRRARAPRAARCASCREPDNFDLPVPVAAAASGASAAFPGAPLFWSALGGLVALGTGLATTALIEDLYARATWLGTLGAALAALAGLSLLVICVREIVGLFRLASIEKLRARAEPAHRAGRPRCGARDRARTDRDAVRDAAARAQPRRTAKLISPKSSTAATCCTSPSAP